MEIPGALSCENMISLLVKITSPLLCNKSRSYAAERQIVKHFIRRTLHGRLHGDTKFRSLC